MICSPRHIYQGNEIKVDEMSGASGMQGGGGEETCTRGFGGEILKNKIACFIRVVLKILLKCMLKI
jgi:hypothetical protein